MSVVVGRGHFKWPDERTHRVFGGLQILYETLVGFMVKWGEQVMMSLGFRLN